MESTNKDYYKILSIERDATPTQIKKSYLKLAVILHPDKGGSEAQFKELAEAYKILSDPEKKKII